MPEDTKEKHTPAPWKAVGEKDCTIDTTDDSYIGKFVLPNPLLTFLKQDDEIKETFRANVRRIVACVNFCKGVSTADLEESLQHGQTLADGDESFVALLDEVGEERGDLRDENERLKERVAELEEACGTVLKWVAHDFKSGLPIPEGTPDAGEAERILRDALSGKNASREAGVPHE
jgi:hypothetical protein